MANIPEEVMHLCILPRLPVKSLVRFTCVSKSWRAVINSPEFVRLHHHHTLSSHKNRLLIVYAIPLQRFQLHELDSSPLAPPLLLPYPKPATCTTPMVLDIVASCEIFLLLSCYQRHVLSTHTFVQNGTWEDHRDTKRRNIYNRHCYGLPRLCHVVLESGRTHVTMTRYRNKFCGLILLNPATGSYHKIPCEREPDIDDKIIYGLCLDHANDDYKIVRIIQSLGTTEVMVYSFKTNSWTLIERKYSSTYDRMLDVAVIGSLLHTINREEKIRCFDIVAEQWTDDIPLPEQINGDELNYSLCVFEGLLCFCARYMDRNQVWVMKESWVKLMNIADPTYDYHPITYRTGSRHELLCTRTQHYSSSDLCWYNLRDKETNQVEYDRYTSISGHICKGSLVNFPGDRKINIMRS
ncbi:hypothetical protein vseg_002889 [Gypsophila vaccaria]